MISSKVTHKWHSVQSKLKTRADENFDQAPKGDHFRALQHFLILTQSLVHGCCCFFFCLVSLFLWENSNPTWVFGEKTNNSSQSFSTSIAREWESNPTPSAARRYDWYGLSETVQLAQAYLVLSSLGKSVPMIASHSCSCMAEMETDAVFCHRSSSIARFDASWCRDDFRLAVAVTSDYMSRYRLRVSSEQTGHFPGLIQNKYRKL